MLESIPVLVTVGTVLGLLAGLGIGGGSLLILWLTMVLGADQMHARAINLLFFLPSAIVASAFRWKQGTLKVKTILPAIVSGCAAAAVCSWLSTAIDLHLLRKLFGGLLIITGIREIFCHSKK